MIIIMLLFLKEELIQQKKIFGKTMINFKLEECNGEREK